MKFARISLLVLLVTLPVIAQQAAKPRVFVEQSESWSVSGNGGGSLWDVIFERTRGGARPQRAEIIKTFTDRCPGAIVTAKAEKADYALLLEHEGGKGIIRRDNKFALFNQDGDSLKSGSTRSLGTAVKKACEELMKDWQTRNTTVSEK